MTLQLTFESFADDFSHILERGIANDWFSRTLHGDGDTEAEQGIATLLGTAAIATTMAPRRMTPLWVEFADRMLPRALEMPAEIAKIVTNDDEVRLSIPADRLRRVFKQESPASNVIPFPRRAHA